MFVPVCVRKRSQAFPSVPKRSRGSRIPRGRNGRETHNCRHLLTSKVSTVTGFGEVALETRKAVVTFGLAAGRHIWTCLWSSRRKSVNNHKDAVNRAGETPDCRHIWTCFLSARRKRVNKHHDRGFVLAKCKTVVTFGLASGPRVAKVSTNTRMR